MVLTTGGEEGQILERIIATTPGLDARRYWPTTGDARFKLRDSLIATKFVDLVIGPETGVTNAAGAFDTPKIPLLTHSNAHNFCEQWTNCYPIQAPAPCSPCYRIVSPGDPCHMVSAGEDPDIAGAAKCMASISVDMIIAKAKEALHL
jgi:ADP-heptose:LPS heptosyltransferase